MDLIVRIQTPESFFFLPHSKKARPDLVNFLKRLKIAHFAFELYDTFFQKLEPIPPLSDFDEIVFTSPSTVEGFLRIYGKLPEDKKLTAIGPITNACLEMCKIEIIA